MTQGWKDLPEGVWEEIEWYTGPVSEVADTAGGLNTVAASVLTCPDGDRVFVKGVHGVSRRMRWLRNETTAGVLAPGIAPAVRFHADMDDWLVVGFDYLPGRPADLSPGSLDLALVASTIDKISALPAPDLPTLRDRWSVTDWWERLE